MQFDARLLNAILLSLEKMKVLTSVLNAITATALNAIQDPTMGFRAHKTEPIKLTTQSSILQCRDKAGNVVQNVLL